MKGFIPPIIKESDYNERQQDFCKRDRQDFSRLHMVEDMAVLPYQPHNEGRAFKAD